MYNEKNLAGIARRENNNKRSYLVVNKLQGKHIPVKPDDALTMYQTLAEKIKESYHGEKLLLIGFAETATAIGAAIAVYLDCYYMQTTREDLGDVNYLYFSESHSHATEQKLVKEDVDQVIHSVDRIVFIEDEVTTGNTILKIVKILKGLYQDTVSYAVASILNGMEEDALKRYDTHGIGMHYLVKTNHSEYGEAAEKYKGDGRSHKIMSEGDGVYIDQFACDSYTNPRRLSKANEMQQLCGELWNQIKDRYLFLPKQKILVLGTEEFMYPPLFVASQMEKCGCDVRFHATTRSPITVSSENEYPLHERHELKSFYDENRVTYIYELKKYDKVFIITDGTKNGLCKDSLLLALKEKGNDDINLIRWSV